MSMNRPGRRYDNRYHNGGSDSRRRPGRHYDRDRQDSHERSLQYSDDSDRRPEKRPRTRSRSPYRESRKPRKYSSGDDDTPHPSRRNGYKPDGGGRISSTEQLVSERGNSPVGAQDSKQKAESRKNQVRRVSFALEPPADERYVVCSCEVNGISSVLTLDFFLDF